MARATGPGAPLKKFHNDIKRRLIQRCAGGRAAGGRRVGGGWAWMRCHPVRRQRQQR